MRIHDAYTKLDRTGGGTGVTKGREASAGGKGASSTSSSAAAGGQGVEVAVSSRARELASASEASLARVSALREKIASGNFSIDAHGIAAKLVGSDE